MTEETLSQAQTLHAQGDRAGAAALCRTILAATPDDVGALHLLGVILSEVGLHSEALPAFERALAGGGADSALLYNYGMTLRALGHLVQAARAFHLAAHHTTADAEFWMALGTTRLALGQFEPAVAALIRTHDLAPDRRDVADNLAMAWVGRGGEQQRARAFAAAHESMLAAVRIAPAMSQAHSNLGNVLRDMGRFGEAEIAFDRALALAPTDTDVIANWSLAYLHAGALDAAIAGYRRAVALNPTDEALHSNLAQALLMAGRFAEGWAAFEHRLSDPAIAARMTGLPGRRWRGEKVAGRTLLLRCEQGLGDAIQFARYIPILAAQGAHVVLAGPRRLGRVLSGLAGLDTYAPDDAPLPLADLHAPLLSVPHLLQTSDIPSDVPYLVAEPARVAAWGARLAPDGRRRIGIAWQGNPSYEMDYLRSIPARYMAELITGQDARVFVLQRGEIPPEIRAAGAEDLGPDLDRDAAFVDTAAVLAHLDLVITSDTALAHLAGALGRPTWLLLPSAPDWRWRLGRTDCDWYPSMHLIRQPHPGDWAGAVAMARVALRAFISG